jgi:hypothetical protein
VLYPFELDFEPTSETYVGFFGHKRYTGRTVDFQEIKSKTKKSATPMFCSVTKSKLEFDVDDMCEVIRGYFFSLSGKSIEVEVVPYTSCTVFYPKFENEYVYENGSWFLRDFDEFVGRSLMSSSLLALDFQLKNHGFYDVQVQEGVVTYASEMNVYVSAKELSLRKNDLESYVEEVESAGYYTAASNSKESEVLVELSEALLLPRKITPETVTVLQNEVKRRNVNMNDQYAREADLSLMIQSLQEVAVAKEILDVDYDFNQWVREVCDDVQLGGTPFLVDYVEGEFLRIPLTNETYEQDQK